MVKTETGNGFFARLKNAFSSNNVTVADETNGENTDTTNNEINEHENGVTEIVVAESQGITQYENITEKEITVRTVEVSAPASYNLPNENDLDIRFATKLIEMGGKFIFCETMAEAIENLKMLKEDQGWTHVFCWENEIKDAFCDSNFQKGMIGYTIENSQAAVSLCEFLAADQGTIVLNPKQASRRRLSCFPKTHIIITDVAHLIGSETDGLDRFKQLNKGELPSVIKLGTCNTGHFYDKQRLILNADGTEDIYVFLVDQLIPPSLRP